MCLLGCINFHYFFGVRWSRGRTSDCESWRRIKLTHFLSALNTHPRLASCDPLPLCTTSFVYRTHTGMRDRSQSWSSVAKPWIFDTTNSHDSPRIVYGCPTNHTRFLYGAPRLATTATTVNRTSTVSNRTSTVSIRCATVVNPH